MHWCSGHLFSACHTYHKNCSHTRACAPMQRCSNFFAMETIANYLVEQIQLQAKLLDYFLESNKSNINQSLRPSDVVSAGLAQWWNGGFPASPEARQQFKNHLCKHCACCRLPHACLLPRRSVARQLPTQENHQNSRQLMTRSRLCWPRAPSSQVCGSPPQFATDISPSKIYLRAFFAGVLE